MSGTATRKGLTMGDLERRLASLETALACDEAVLAWAEVHNAQRRQAARAWLVLGARLGMDASDPRLLEANALLVGDTPARRAADDDLATRWDRQQGIAKGPGTARERWAQRLAMMARRTEGGGDARRSARDH